MKGQRKVNDLEKRVKGRAIRGLAAIFYKGLGFCSKRSLEALVECERRTVERSESQQDTKHRNLRSSGLGKRETWVVA